MLTYSILGVLSNDGWTSVIKELASVLHNGVQSISPMRSSAAAESAEVNKSLLQVIGVVSEILLEKQCLKRMVEDNATSDIIVSLFEATFIESDELGNDQVKVQIHNQADIAWKHLKEDIVGDDVLAEGVGNSICRYISTALMDSENVAK